RSLRAKTPHTFIRKVRGPIRPQSGCPRSPLGDKGEFMTAFESAHAIAGASGAVGYRPEVRLLPSITQIPKVAWEEMLPGEPECWDFYRSVENIPPPGFTMS